MSENRSVSEEQERRFERAVSRAKIRLRTRSPFFGTLLFHAQVYPDPYLRTAATDGRDVYVSPDFMAGLTAAEQDTLLLHEVLHAALRHTLRRGARTPIRWNVAADIVVNGILRAQPWARLPEGGIIGPDLEERSVEEVYALLPAEAEISKRVASPVRWHRVWGDLLEGKGGPGRSRALRGRWQRALRQAQAAAAHASGSGQGHLPAGLERLVEEAAAPRVNWRQVLWRFLAKTPTDFAGYDRRFVHKGLYLETLQAQSLTAHVAVDTSGSVTDDVLAEVLAEVRGIRRSYPQVNVHLYYADAALHGPHVLRREEAPPKPKGGGGTSFVPFFEALRETDPPGESVAIYLTDGYGDFPEEAPPQEVLWAVVPGGLPSEAFPFGEVVRLIPDEAFP